jgi:hypothetical protein
MPENLQTALEEIVDLAGDSRGVGPAQDRFLDLLGSLDSAAAVDNRDDLIETAKSFYPKRRKRLLAAIKERCEPFPQRPLSLGRAERGDIAAARIDLRRELEDLRAKHIFQWTLYWRVVDRWQRRIRKRVAQISNQDDYLIMVSEEFSRHSSEIFRKGYDYGVETGNVDAGGRKHLVVKATSGLSRFLELPVEMYSAEAGSSFPGVHARALRSTTSAMLLGILRGFGNVSFGEDTGHSALSDRPATWLYATTFLRGADLSDLAASLPADPIEEGLRHVMLPLCLALDVLASTDEPDRFALPGQCHFFTGTKRLDVSLLTPHWVSAKRPIEIQAYLDPGCLERTSLEEATSRNVEAVIAQTRGDLRRWVTSHDYLRTKVVDPSREHGAPEAAAKLVGVLEIELGKQRSPTDSRLPLTINIASQFPLHNPELTKYFRVLRGSVRELLTGFENRNGVRLWCSVRRSGKTTACFDLGSSSGDATIVAQTCARTAPSEGSNLLYERCEGALEAGSRIPTRFLQDIVDKVAEQASQASRYVLLLDEYETLFRRLFLAGCRDPELRYTVVQPLLDQMVMFGTRNLLVLVGQQPDAHFIFMDQNQLSAYVKQDPFPLFVHKPGDANSEFAGLLGKVLTQHVGFDGAFCDAVFEETSGHPYLTVKALIGFFDWLIRRKRPISELEFVQDDFRSYSAVQLKPEQLGLSDNYSFFRNAIAEAMGDYGRNDNPWLALIYSVMREIAQDSPDTFRVSRADFNEIVYKLGDRGISPADLLQAGVAANFFSLRLDTVQPRIRLLGRLAGITQPRNH